MDFREQNSDLVARELEHRLKNILNIVQALARMTFPDAPPEQRAAFDKRIIALSEANKVLQEAAWQEADLGTIVREVTGRLGVAERIACEGADVSVAPSDATGLALAIHELCTNALKYGSLSTERGRVRVAWDLDPAQPRHIRAVWQEHDGPAVAEPQYTGFGMRLIRRALSGPDGMSATVHFDPAGLACEMILQRAEPA